MIFAGSHEQVVASLTKLDDALKSKELLDHQVILFTTNQSASQELMVKNDTKQLERLCQDVPNIKMPIFVTDKKLWNSKLQLLIQPQALMDVTNKMDWLPEFQPKKDEASPSNQNVEINVEIEAIYQRILKINLNSGGDQIISFKPHTGPQKLRGKLVNDNNQNWIELTLDDPENKSTSQSWNVGNNITNSIERAEFRLPELTDKLGLLVSESRFDGSILSKIQVDGASRADRDQFIAEQRKRLKQL
ncbi:hypothetical protein AMR42_12375 [Limnothrix sp. PR1529]|nr:hypothetical protein BCR12_01200 [Limnothrix sp. P13C2]PIB09806.1 hypothetical protein AMR42_12375 [Limnothrix sp. PR1529]